MAFRFHPDCGLAFVFVGRDDDACRRYVIPNQLHVYGARGAAEEFLAYGEFCGLRLPSAGEAVWHLALRDFTYIDLRVEEIKYESDDS
jgi:hypothetical protein